MSSFQLSSDKLLSERQLCNSFPDSFPRLVPQEKSLGLPRIVVLGDGGVGKTCLIMNFIHHTFVEHFDPTIEDVYRVDRVIDTKPLRFEILDTAGQEDFAVLVRIWSRMGDASVIVYDIFDVNSYERAKEIAKELFVAKTGWTPGILVGNKVDLVNDGNVRTVSERAAREFATSIGWPFFETSAKTGFQLEEVFHNAIRGANWVKRRSNGQSPPSSDPLDPGPSKPSSGWRCILL